MLLSHRIPTGLQPSSVGAGLIELITLDFGTKSKAKKRNASDYSSQRDFGSSSRRPETPVYPKHFADKTPSKNSSRPFPELHVNKFSGHSQDKALFAVQNIRLSY